MATGSVAFKFDAGLNKVLNMNSAAAAGTSFAYGTLDFQASYTTGGISVNLPFNNVNYIHMDLTSGLLPQFDYTNSLIKVYGQTKNGSGAADTATGLSEIHDGMDLASWSAVRFIAFGH
jgi:hypothetical protein